MIGEGAGRMRFAHPELVERPIVETPKGLRLCRPAERVAEVL